jgi:hypothetical protein
MNLTIVFNNNSLSISTSKQEGKNTVKMGKITYSSNEQNNCWNSEYIKTNP